MSEATSTKYISSVGRRKTSVATVRLFESPKLSVTINDKSLADYFQMPSLQRIVTEALALVGKANKVKITVHVNGGGIHSQAEAVRHAIARALIKGDIEFRKALKKEGFLKRDPRAKERRKFGLKKARKAPQWSKR